MVMKCTCGLDNSYRDLVVHQLVIHGMRDQEIRQRVLSKNTSSDLTTLTMLVDYIAAEEAGVSKSNNLNTGLALVRGIRKKSEFQKNKSKCCGNTHRRTVKLIDRNCVRIGARAVINARSLTTSARSAAPLSSRTLWWSPWSRHHLVGQHRGGQHHWLHLLPTRRFQSRAAAACMGHSGHHAALHHGGPPPHAGCTQGARPSHLPPPPTLCT